MTDYEILMIGLTFTSLVVTLLIAYIRKSASPIRFLAVDFLVIPEISERYFLHNKKITAPRSKVAVISLNNLHR